MATPTPVQKSQKEISEGKDDVLARGNLISRKNDSIKDFTVSIRDIDSAVRYYFQNVIKPTVVEADKIVNVPVIYGSPERWKSIQRDGYFKDEKDKVILPLIVYKRNTITKDDGYAIDKLDANNPNLLYSYQKKYSMKNKYDNFAVNIGNAPLTEFYSVVVPDYVILNYEFIILTEAVSQMNKILESVIYSEGSYWGEPERFKFRTKIQSYDTNIEIATDTQRTVKTNFSLEMNGYLLPDTINKGLSIQAENFNVAYSPKQVFFGFDTDRAATLPTLGSAIVTTGTPGLPSISSIQGGTTNVIGKQITDYLALVVTRVADSSSLNTMVFDGVNVQSAPEPSGLTTSKENFHFLVNGQYISSNFVTSVVDSGSSVVTTFDTASMGYNLGKEVNPDSLVGVGKFLIL